MNTTQDKSRSDRLDTVAMDKVMNVEVMSPSLPDLDVVDLPGLSHTWDMELQRPFLEQFTEDSGTIFLLICPFTSPPYCFYNVLRLRELHLEDRAMVVVTKTDLLDLQTDYDVKHYERALTEALGLDPSHPLLQRVVFTSSKPYDRKHTHLSQPLKFQDRKELQFFTSPGLGDLMRSHRAGVHSLLMKLSQMIHNDMKRHWLPGAITCIQREVVDEYHRCKDHLSELKADTATRVDRPVEIDAGERASKESVEGLDRGSKESADGQERISKESVDGLERASEDVMDRLGKLLGCRSGLINLLAPSEDQLDYLLSQEAIYALESGERVKPVHGGPSSQAATNSEADYSTKPQVSIFVTIV